MSSSDRTFATRIDEARRDQNPTVISKLPSGWVVLGDTQFLRGYSLLLADPVVESLNAISGSERMGFLADMALLGDAVQAATGADRINYSVLGNSLPVLHAHVFPRYEREPDEAKRRPVWLYPKAERSRPAFDLRHDAELMQEIEKCLRRFGAQIEERQYPWRHCVAT